MELAVNETGLILSMGKKEFIRGVLASTAFENYTEMDCEIAFEATSRTLMQLIRSVHVILCTGGVVVTALLIFVLLSRPARHLHFNLRVSLLSLAVAGFIACAQLLFTAISSFILIVLSTDKCDMLFNASSCALLRWPVVLSIYSTLAGMISLAIERTIATSRYRTYEVHGCTSVGIILICVQWATSLFFSVASVFLRHDNGYVHYCTVYVSHPKSAVVSLCVMSLLEVGTLFFFTALLIVNKRKQMNEFVNNALHSLTERYQLLENIRTMHMLIPSVTVHATLSLAGFVALLAFALTHKTMRKEDIVQFSAYSEVVLLFVPIYSIVFPLVAVMWNPQMQQSVRRSMPMFFRPPLPVPGAARPPTELQKDSDRHFGLLAEMWNK